MLVDKDGNPINPANQTPDTSQGNNDGKPQGDKGADNASGTANASNVTDNKKLDKPEGITVEVQAYIDAQAAAARRDGESKAKAKLVKEQEDAKANADKQAAEAKGEFEKLRNDEVAAHNATKAERDNTQRELNQMKAAMAAKVPDADKHYKRIQGESYDEMLEDAKVVAATFTGGAYRDANNPPIIPTPNDGGKFDQTGKTPKVSDEDMRKAQGTSSAYNVF